MTAALAIARGACAKAPGTHRTRAPGAALARARAAQAACGVTRLAELTHLDRIGLPVFAAIRPEARSIAVSMGKGLEPDHARASALMESIEVWHAERIDAPLRWGSAEALGAPRSLIDVARLPTDGGAPFDAAAPMLWIEAEDLLGGAPPLVPFDLVHADYAPDSPPRTGFLPMSTNGLASGTHPLEARIHALCEVIERDALAVLEARGRGGRRLDPASVEDARARRALDMVAGAGLAVALWDATSDLGVATVLCALREPDGTGHPGLGSGTHPDRAAAVLRAVTEAAQVRLTYVAGAREDLRAAEYGEAGRRAADRAIAAMMAADDGPARALGTVPHAPSATLDADLGHLLERLDAVGVRQVAAIDLTRPEIGLDVVRVVVPGLEPPHDDEGYVPGPRARA